MKTLSLAALLTLTGGIAGAQEAGQQFDSYDDSSNPGAEDTALADTDDGYDPQAYTQFESQLSPYGTWYDDATYGRVWTPSVTVVGNGFTPYATGGRWVWGNGGWTWASDYNWGWAPFHYGRWISVGSRWCWRPGRTWTPGAVAWRHTGRHVGWAPLPPRMVVRDHRYAPNWRYAPAAQFGRSHMSYASAPAYRGRTYAAPVRQVYRQAPVYRGAVFHTSPAYRAPAYRSAPAYHGGGGSFRASAGVRYHGR